MWTVRSTALLVAALLLGCASPAPSLAPTPPPPDARSVSATITEDGLRSGLVMLADVTDASNGYRSLGSPGYAAAVEAVATSLRASGWTVSDDAFTAPTFTDDGGSSLEADGQRFGEDDIRPLIFAPAGDVTGPVVALDWLPGAAARDGKGCRTADFGELPDGAVVLVRPGPCFRRDQVLAAQAAGAAAFVAGYGGAPSGAAPRATLVDPGGLTIPAIGATGRAADALASVAEAGGVARVTTAGRTAEAATRSIIAELPGSEPSSVVMLGAHLDSVLDGPGLNDDGSGVAALLAIARALQGTRPRASVRLAFWSGEELGLLGSSHYVAELTEAERARVVAYLNADMIGSPNGYAGVYYETDAPPGSAALGALLDAAVERAGGVPVDVAIGASSDHVAFEQAGIPIGGLFSGAGEAVTQVQATSSGAAAGQPADACYHQACDGLENVDLSLARQLTTALADVAVRLAATPELLAK